MIVKFYPPRLRRPISGCDLTHANLRSAPPAVSNEDGNWWIVTLSDLTLLLLGFMVVWYVTVSRATKPAPVPAAANPSIENQPSFPVAHNRPGSPELPQNIHDELLNFVNARRLGKDITVESAANELVISLRDTVPFASGKADLRLAARPLIDKVAQIALRHSSLNLEITGHTDDRPISTEQFPSNWELSAARAGRVARHLIEKGVHPSRIAVQGYASLRPRASDSSFKSRSANRRVEIRFYQEIDKAPR
jgi:chemotaxis protein MotB